jgi:hypothetical protein
MATMRQRRHLPRGENDCDDPSKPSRLMLNWSICSSQNGASGIEVESPFPTTRFGLKECARTRGEVGARETSPVEEDLATVSLPSEIHSLSAPRLSSLTRRNGLSFDNRRGSGGPAAAAPTVEVRVAGRSIREAMQLDWSGSCCVATRNRTVCRC